MYRVTHSIADAAWHKAVRGVEELLRPCQACGKQPSIDMERKIDLSGEAFQIRCPGGCVRHEVRSHADVLDERGDAMYKRWNEAIRILGEWWDERQEEVRVASMFPGVKK